MPRIQEIYKIHNPDIILIAHTAHQPGAPKNDPPIKFFPYKVMSLNTAGLYSGVAIMVKPHIKFSPINHKFESDTLAIKVETMTGPIILVVNYTPRPG